MLLFIILVQRRSEIIILSHVYTCPSFFTLSQELEIVVSHVSAWLYTVVVNTVLNRSFGISALLINYCIILDEDIGYSRDRHFVDYIKSSKQGRCEIVVSCLKGHHKDVSYFYKITFITQVTFTASFLCLMF